MRESGSLLEFSIWVCSYQVKNLKASSLFHLLKGKRTTSVIFFALNYHLEKYFACLPDLNKDDFENIISQMVSSGYLSYKDGYIEPIRQPLLTDALTIFSNMDLYSLSLMTNESLVFLSEASVLLVQVISQSSFQENKYSPTTNNSWIQHLCKSWFATKKREEKVDFHQLCKKISQELWSFLDAQESLYSSFFLSYFTGYKFAPATRQQRMLIITGDALEDGPFVDRFSWIYFFQELIRQEERYPLCCSFLTYFIHHQGLSSRSSQITYSTFLKGVPLSQIAKHRSLKESTINDHLIEVALVYPASIARRILFLGQSVENTTIIQNGLDLIKQKPKISFDSFQQEINLHLLNVSGFMMYRLSQIVLIKEKVEVVDNC